MKLTNVKFRALLALWLSMCGLTYAAKTEWAEIGSKLDNPHINKVFDIRENIFEVCRAGIADFTIRPTKAESAMDVFGRHVAVMESTVAYSSRGQMCT